MSDPGRTTLPNFLIVGGVRCGTTSLCTSLKSHPRIGLGRIREPSYFCAQFMRVPGCGPGDERRAVVRTLAEYSGIFAAHAGRPAVGDASPDTLHYAERAVPLIRALLGDPRIVILLRDPVDRAYSAFRFLVREGRETLALEAALAQEDRRIEAGWDVLWHYRRCGFYADAVKLFLDQFSRVRVYLFDDFNRHPDMVLQDLYQFLQVETPLLPGAADTSPVFSGEGALRAAWRRLGLWLWGEEGYVQREVERRARRRRKSSMNPATREALARSFWEDIRKLAGLLGRDLSHWASEGRPR